jgi:hypothetical protein
MNPDSINDFVVSRGPNQELSQTRTARANNLSELLLKKNSSVGLTTNPEVKKAIVSERNFRELTNNGSPSAFKSGANESMSNHNAAQFSLDEDIKRYQILASRGEYRKGAEPRSVSQGVDLRDPDEKA